MKIKGDFIQIHQVFAKKNKVGYVKYEKTCTNKLEDLNKEADVLQDTGISKIRNWSNIASIRDVWKNTLRKTKTVLPRNMMESTKLKLTFSFGLLLSPLSINLNYSMSKNTSRLNINEGHS